MEPQKQENSLKPGSEAMRKSRQRVRCEESVAGSAQWDVPWSDDRRRCTKDPQFFQFLKDKSLTEGCVRCSEDVRGYNERDEGTQVPQWILKEPSC